MMIHPTTTATSLRAIGPTHGPCDPDGGWLGQVPPPPAPEPAREEEPPQHAAPWLTPEPWKHDEPLYPHDPTLFG